MPHSLTASVFRACVLLTTSACLQPSAAPPPERVASQMPQPLGGRNGAAIFLYRWRWQDIMQRMGDVRDAGFTAVQISPHTATCGTGAGYDPYDFTNFNSPSFGSESDLFWLVGTAHYYNLQIYADMVMNHMCASNYQYPRFGWNDFHHNGAIRDFNDIWWRENGDLFGLNDLAHESGYVRGELHNFLVKTRVHFINAS